MLENRVSSYHIMNILANYLYHRRLITINNTKTTLKAHMMLHTTQVHHMIPHNITYITSQEIKIFNIFNLITCPMTS